MSETSMKEAIENNQVTFQTYEDFQIWTETQAGYWILVRGVPMPSPSPVRIHQEISKRLQMILIEAVEKTKIGKVYDAPLDVKLSEDTVYQPDLMVILKKNYGRMKRYIDGAPDLVMEILSPGSAKLDLVDKKYDYAAAGVSEYWIIDPDTATIEMYTEVSGGFVLKSSARQEGVITSSLIPGLSVQLSDLFRDL